MKYLVWVIIIGFVIGGVAIFLPAPRQTSSTALIAAAKTQYYQAQSMGISFENGPCLGPLPDDEDWVVDVVHNPRQATDDEPNNQCADFVEGKVNHFIELDTKGEFVRMN